MKYHFIVYKNHIELFTFIVKNNQYSPICVIKIQSRLNMSRGLKQIL